MTGIKGERQYLNDGKTIDVLVILIENDDLKLNVTVLGEMADQIKGFMATGEQQLSIVVLQFARKIMYGIRLLINSDVPETVML
ncbi:hypothetical protein Ahy_B05g076733 isoform A [Arachis hypogaea]|uniref:Uncharacterized protein n=1 Tax=Arachis hypogaea TaxID=3818 RepID=A0A444Z3V8_ARAHY|nr:hypothetical protein Ahy_B05g076733 isoform A [Arachis hypogaea]